jgi:hypothetical protein
MTFKREEGAQSEHMSPLRPPQSATHPGANEPSDSLRSIGTDDTMAWARNVWEHREHWLQARGGVESVFTAAQILGCRDDAVRWLKSRARI